MSHEYTNKKQRPFVHSWQTNKRSHEYTNKSKDIRAFVAKQKQKQKPRIKQKPFVHSWQIKLKCLFLVKTIKYDKV